MDQTWFRISIDYVLSKKNQLRTTKKLRTFRIIQISSLYTEIEEFTKLTTQHKVIIIKDFIVSIIKLWCKSPVHPVTGEPLFSWLESYVSGRKQFLKSNDVCLSTVDIASGVPQGGHLSPVLFALFINGIRFYYIIIANFLYLLMI